MIFRGGEFSTGEMGNFHSALTDALKPPRLSEKSNPTAPGLSTRGPS